MARNRDPFTTAVRVLSERATGGAFLPRTPIVILSEAEALSLSTTPVREALAWLGGEGLIERSPGGGYIGLNMDPQNVAGRYRLRGLCVNQALQGAVALAALARTEPEPASALFSRLMRSGGDPVLIDVYDRVERQLAALVESERRTLGTTDDEGTALRLAIADGDPHKAVAAVEDYHRRRIEAVPLIVEDLLSHVPVGP